MKDIDQFYNKITHGDSLEVMKTMPDESVDVVLTSPPYNLKNSTGNGMKDGRGGKWSNAALMNGYDEYNDNLPNDVYAEWQYRNLREMYRILKPDGAIFYNHKWRVQGGLIQDRSDIIRDMPVRQIIIWQRNGGINFNKGYFLPTYEVIYLIPKSKFKLAPKANRYGDVWKINQDFKNPHPAPFPFELADRVVKSTTGGVILDPFMGSGTTAVAAIAHGRKYIGIEKSEKYIKMANERIDKFKKGSIQEELNI
ncbi:DNA-methyltransferase [Limosilactobacillus reuteri]|uniref:DNA-methyltransferase n=1 Tax=Limosilactobacillus reuteri TaxID=1598 RepID=UPI000A326C48|nr:DNA methyltransferase [Limosilactobacillus reuteri]